MSDMIPDFSTPYVRIPKPVCRWEDLHVWDGRKPGLGDTVVIPEGVTVIYSGYNEEAITTLIIRGTLTFEEDDHSLLKVQNVVVEGGGRLNIGTPDSPIIGSAELVFTGEPFDLNRDPEQYGCGLIVKDQAELTICGTFKNPHLVITDDIPAGSLTAKVEYIPTHWYKGDRVMIPPSGGKTMYYPGNARAPEVKQLDWTKDDNLMAFLEPFEETHPVGRDVVGNADCFIDACNLDRNVVVRSGSPNGIRGHVLITDEADFTLSNALFQDLGRTTDDLLDSTTFDDNGQVTHYGKNQIGRYALHVHHLQGGPKQPNRYRFTIEGCVIERSRKWAIAIHDSHCGLVYGNTIYDCQAAGIATEDGSESYTEFTGNRIAYVRRGDGFWLNGIHNLFQDNAVYCCLRNQLTNLGGTGFYAPPNPNVYRIITVPTPSGGTEEFFWGAGKFLSFKSNQACGTRFGLWLDHSHAEHFIEDFRVWWGYEYVEDGAAVFAYDTGGVTYSRLTARGCSVGVSSNVLTKLVNCDIQGCEVGIRDIAQNGHLILDGCYLRNAKNMKIVLAQSAGAGPIPTGPIKQTDIINTLFRQPAGLPADDIELSVFTQGTGSCIPVVANTIRVFGYDAMPGDDFRIYFEEQEASVIVPYEGDLHPDPPFVKKACPERGLTNRQAWDKYGVAWAGSVCPDNHTTREGIIGLVVGGQP